MDDKAFSEIGFEKYWRYNCRTF